MRFASIGHNQILLPRSLTGSYLIKLAALVALALIGSTPLSGQESDIEYVGSRKCRVCHRSEKKGDQYGIWSSSRHAGSLETLKSNLAIKTATELGLTTVPSEAPECLECHVTGWGKPGGYEILSPEFVADESSAKAIKKNTALASVSCESCHGAGSAYKGKKIMKQIFDGEIDGHSVGLNSVKETTCRGCHNERSPQFEGFDFEKMIAKITHPYPEDFRDDN